MPTPHPTRQTWSSFSEEKCWPQNVRQSRGQKRCHVLKTDFEMNVCSRNIEPVLHRKETGGSHSREPGRPMEKGSNGTNLRDPGNVYLITQNPFVNFCELKGTFNQFFSISLLNMNIELKKSSGRKIRTTEKKKLRGKRGRVRNGRKLQESYNYHITSRKQ